MRKTEWIAKKWFESAASMLRHPAKWRRWHWHTEEAVEEPGDV